MAVKGLIGKGILFSLVVVFVISGVLSDEVHPQPCSGVTEAIGKVACDENSSCYNPYPDSVACACKPGYSGDAWKLGTGCYQDDEEEAGLRQKRAAILPGFWGGSSGTSQPSLKPCKGVFAVMAALFCASNANCLASNHPSTFKCVCPPGKTGTPYNMWNSFVPSGCF